MMRHGTVKEDVLVFSRFMLRSLRVKCHWLWASQVTLVVKNLPVKGMSRELRVRSLGERSRKGMAVHSQYFCHSESHGWERLASYNP